jgi:hypothetical protein
MARRLPQCADVSASNPFPLASGVPSLQKTGLACACESGKPPGRCRTLVAATRADGSSAKGTAFALSAKLWIILIFVLTFWGCGQSEVEDISKQFAQVPGVRTLHGWGGNEGIFATGNAFVNVSLDDGSSMSFTHLSRSSFSDAPRPFIGAVGGLTAHTQQCEPRALLTFLRTTVRSKEDVVVDLKQGPFSRELGTTIENVGKAVAFHESIHALLQRWPTCPAYVDTTKDDGTLVRYCAETDDGRWTPVPLLDCR